MPVPHRDSGPWHPSPARHLTANKSNVQQYEDSDPRWSVPVLVVASVAAWSALNVEVDGDGVPLPYRYNG